MSFAVLHNHSHYRGTIIVDTSVIYDLAGKISDKYKSDSPERYLDILPFLAANGYKIEIPEIVAAEAAQVLHDGKHVGKFFSSLMQSEVSKILVPFFQKVAAGKYPGIEIVPSKDPPRVNQYLEQLRSSTELFKKMIKTARDSGLSKRDARESAITQMGHVLAGVHKDIPGGLGDETIRHMVRKECESSHQANLYVLSDDKKLLDTLPKYVQTLTTRRFVYSFVHHGLHAHMGLKADVTPVEIIEDYINNKPPGIAPKRSPHHFDAGRYLKGLQIHSRFFKDMEKLAADLRQLPDNTSPAGPSREESEQVRKYRERLGRRMNPTGQNIPGR